MCETGTQQSTRYCGALLWTHGWTVTLSLYRTRSATSSQCKSACKVCDSPQSYLREPLTRRAAAFSTRCSLSVTDLGELATIPCCSSQLELSQKHGQVSSRTHRPVIVELVEVGVARRNMTHIMCASCFFFQHIMLETCLFRLRSANKVTPSART